VFVITALASKDWGPLNNQSEVIAIGINGLLLAAP
jgi:hypothetical protein